jgi:hypothetical protein
MTLYDVFQRNRGLFATADAVQGTFGEINVLQILEVLENRFADIKSLGAAGAPGEFFQALFQRIREGGWPAWDLAIQV